MTEENASSGGEFEREPVPDSALLGSGKFWGMYAGEHAAGTEFMIGPLFLAAGASLSDLILGLLLGNFLAVLTWRFLVVPIAMAKRMTLYYQLERIAGGSLVKFYNLVNGLLFCFLAGAMVTRQHDRSPLMSVRIPKYRHHKPSGQALVQIRGRRTFLGKYGSEESKERYHRLNTGVRIRYLSSRRYRSVLSVDST